MKYKYHISMIILNHILIVFLECAIRKYICFMYYFLEAQYCKMVHFFMEIEHY